MGSDIEQLKKAAEQGNAKAQLNLGVCYYVGKFVTQDYKKAAECFRKAAEQGLADAQYMLSWCYYNGHGVHKKPKIAMEWLFRAAEQGHADAQFRLGFCYDRGLDVDQNLIKAVEWYHKAAEQGQVDAQYHLGLCYAKRLSRAYKDSKEAVEWFHKAAEQGHADAQKKLKKIYKKHDFTQEHIFKHNEKTSEQDDADMQKHLDETGKYEENKEKIAIWLNSIKHEFGCEILCENVREISKDEDSAEYIVNGRKYIGKESFQTLKIKSHDKVPEFESKDLCIYKDSYDDMVFAVIDYDVPTFDIYDRMYDGRHYLFFFHNKKKISAMYCAEGYNLGEIRIFENITPVNDSLTHQLKELGFPL